ncbi:serine/threonine-protein kinase [Pseudonocardia thermophila]|uniref:serine/threonine-protein kinase n=1 Tax=Pseudonocardia thermophila TaxID=1848 RepID=UPI00248E3894|nr:serine/threonine-protein kinase [Pseudonocardia thermophila]
MTGERFGRYVLVDLLGRGGMGEVWRARDTATGQTVAVKRLAAGLAGEPAFAARFRRECAVAARLSDPHIVPVLDVGEIDGRLYLTMPCVEGADLAQLLVQEGPLPPERAVHVITQVAAALDAAHRAGLVHRDVKPSNVLVTPDGRAYLTDFGIARGGDDTAVTTAGATVGTLAYMAPERFDDAPLNALVDVYALACVLHEALTAQKPFPVTGPVPMMSAHLMQPPPRPSLLRPGVPPALDDVVARGMAKDPAQRHPTAGALAAHAQAALGAAPGMPTPPVPGAEAAPGRRRAVRWIAAAAGAAVVVAAAATVVVVAPWRGSGGVAQLPPGTATATTAVPPTTAAPTSAAPVGPVTIAMRQPTSLVAAADGRTAFGVDDTGVTRIDLVTATATPLAAVPGYAAALTPDGTRLLVLTQDGDLTVLSTADGAVLADADVGSVADGLSVSADGRWAYVATLSTVAVVDVATARIVHRASVGNSPTGTAAGLDAVYASWVELQHGGGQLLVADPATAAVTDRIPVGDYPLDVAVAGARVLVRDRPAVWVVDPRSGTVTQVRGVAGPLAVAAAPDGSRAYALTSGAVAVIDPDSATVVASITAPGARAADVPGSPGALAVTGTALVVGTGDGVLVLPR